jgi:hypothetical protein
MKNTIIIFLLAVSLQTAAQKPWTKYEMDSTEFVGTFGSLAQYEYQHGIADRSSHKNLFLWVGAKSIYFEQVKQYLELVGKYNADVEWTDDNKVIVTATPSIYTTDTPPTIKFIASVNSSEQVTSVKITGPADDVINFFVGYWELSDLSFNELKSKKAVVKEFVSDKVSFSWPGADPVITVTKNSNAPINMFAIN